MEIVTAIEQNTAQIQRVADVFEVSSYIFVFFLVTIFVISIWKR